MVMRDSDIPNWTFHTQVISKALDVIAQQAATLQPVEEVEFYTAETVIALEESRESLMALQTILQAFETAQDAPLSKKRA